MTIVWPSRLKQRKSGSRSSRSSTESSSATSLVRNCSCVRYHSRSQCVCGTTTRWVMSARRQYRTDARVDSRQRSRASARGFRRCERQVAAEDRATTARDPKLRVWPLALGAVGLVCGFFGPLALSPDGGLGPLLGLLITGPGGAALGLASGLAVRRLPLQPGARWELLGASCLVVALWVLYAAMPAPKLCGEIIDAEIRGCTPPSVDATVQPAHAGNPGGVLELHVVRRRGIYETQKPWNRGKLLARAWETARDVEPYFAHFAGGSCADYEPGRRVFSPTRSTDSLPTLRPVPEEYLRFAGP